jgi:hypothetical protein
VRISVAVALNGVDITLEKAADFFESQLKLPRVRIAKIVGEDKLV